MSRALDAQTIAALETGNRAQIYADISSALGALDELHEIEILGRSFPLSGGQNLVRDGNAIGVPKLRLVQAFFVARRVLLRNVNSSRRGGVQPGDGGEGAEEVQGVGGQATQKTQEDVKEAATKMDQDAAAKETQQDSIPEIRAATAVVLLMDPEHLTAANTRKRCLLGDLDSHNNDDNARKAIFHKETCFVDSLLTSPLHRHTKSPVLWSHRRWLVQEQTRRGIHPTTTSVREAISRVVMVAGEKHSRNYYAWCHARWLVSLLPQSLLSSSSPSSPSPSPLDEIVECVRDWCCRHRSDISGWSFLLHVLRAGAGQGGELAQRVRRDVAELGARLRWENEAFVWFLNMGV